MDCGMKLKEKNKFHKQNKFIFHQFIFFYIYWNGSCFYSSNNKTTRLKDMKSLLYILTILLFTSSVNASKSYNGYIILNDNSRIEGIIQMLSPTLNEVKVKFISKEGDKQTFKAKEVKEYGFKVELWNHKTRIHESSIIVYSRQKVLRSPVPFGPTQVLLERQITGHINLYNHFIEANTNTDAPIAHIIYVKKITENDLVSINKENYKTILKRMTAEYPELSARIGKKGHTFKSLTKTIGLYNEWMLDNGEEMVMEME